MKRYDYLVVGAGLYGAVFAQKAHAAGKSVLVVDKSAQILPAMYTLSRCRGHTGPQIWRAYLPYQQQDSLGLCYRQFADV